MKSKLISKQNVKKLTNSHRVVSRTNNGPVQLTTLFPMNQLQLTGLPKNREWPLFWAAH